MELNVMLLPEKNDCPELFYHTAASPQCTAQSMTLPAGAEVTFDAYYNLFPAKTYRDYTSCIVPVLHAHVRGSGTVFLNACSSDGTLLAQASAEFCHPETAEVSLTLSLPEETAALYWSCTAGSECELHGAHLTFPEASAREVTLAVGICTYRREKFITRNAARISALFEQMGGASHHLFISDNAGTLAGILPDSPRVTVMQNPNTGGSGGFARVMQETLQSETEFTHLLLMDDDIDFRPEILGRLLFFLSRCRAEFAHVTVGGAMCLLDAPWIQFEAGAKFLEGGTLQGLMQDLDLRDAKNCIRNAAAPQEADYNSWWCCCMSVERIRSAGLSMPFFFKMDDVEYALRLGEPVVCLSGVCVAHEDFVKKYNPALEYYITRNTLITAALHDRLGGKAALIRRMISAVLRNTLLQRYETAELILRGYGDFLKGAEFLRNTDASALHQEILQCAPKCEPAPEGTELSDLVPVSGMLRLLTLGGMLLPCDRDSAVVDAFHAGSAEGFRVREIRHYYPMTGMMYRTQLRRGNVLRLCLRTAAMAARLCFDTAAAVNSLKTEAKFMSSAEFWQECNRIMGDL